jgi:hypothetical protein
LCNQGPRKSAYKNLLFFKHFFIFLFFFFFFLRESRDHFLFLG